MTCPDAELLAAMAEGRLSGKDREALLDHAAGCDDCRQTLLIVGTPRLVSRPAARTWIPWAAAAAFVVSVIGVLALGSATRREGPAGANAPRRIPEKVQPRPEPPKQATVPSPEPRKPEELPRPAENPIPRKVERPIVPDSPVPPEKPQPPKEP